MLVQLTVDELDERIERAVAKGMASNTNAVAMGDDDDLVGSKAAAKMLGMSARTLRQWAADGKVPSQQAGKDYRFKRGDIRARQQSKAR